MSNTVTVVPQEPSKLSAMPASSTGHRCRCPSEIHCTPSRLPLSTGEQPTSSSTAPESAATPLASSPGIEGHYPVVLPTPPVPAGETPPLFLNLVPLPDRAPRLVHGEHEQGKRFLPTPIFFSIIEQ
jgi:hypothetical protein